MSSRRPSESPGGAVPEGRYGPAGRQPRTRRRGRKLRWIAFAIMVAIVLGLIAFIAYYNLGPKPIEANRTTFKQLSDHSMAMTVQVNRDQPQRPSVCVVRVRSINGLETGRREVIIPAGQSSVRTIVRSTRPPVAASVVGCSYDIPSYMSTGVPPLG